MPYRQSILAHMDDVKCDHVQPDGLLQCHLPARDSHNSLVASSFSLSLSLSLSPSLSPSLSLALIYTPFVHTVLPFKISAV